MKKIKNWFLWYFIAMCCVLKIVIIGVCWGGPVALAAYCHNDLWLLTEIITFPAGIATFISMLNIK